MESVSTSNLSRAALTDPEVHPVFVLGRFAHAEVALGHLGARRVPREHHHLRISGSVGAWKSSVQIGRTLRLGYVARLR